MKKDPLPPVGYDWNPATRKSKPFLNDEQKREIGHYLKGTPDDWYPELALIYRRFHKDRKVSSPPSPARTEKEVSTLADALKVIIGFQNHHKASYADITLLSVTAPADALQRTFNELSVAAPVVLRECNAILKEISAWKKAGGGRPRGAVEDSRTDTLLREFISFYEKHHVSVTPSVKNRRLHVFVRDCLEPLEKIEKVKIYPNMQQLRDRVNRLRGTKK